jgi:hypothetical protein
MNEFRSVAVELFVSIPLSKRGACVGYVGDVVDEAAVVSPIFKKYRSIGGGNLVSV